jgi:hypothetical protein
MFVSNMNSEAMNKPMFDVVDRMWRDGLLRDECGNPNS